MRRRKNDQRRREAGKEVKKVDGLSVYIFVFTLMSAAECNYSHYYLFNTVNKHLKAAKLSCSITSSFASTLIIFI